MAGPIPNYMATITASLERSFQNCSLNNNNNSGDDEGTSGSTSNPNHQNSNDTTLELNSHISLPYHWEQCLDLKTGEIYYINWRNGMKAKEDPRNREKYSTRDYNNYYSEEEYEDDDDDEDEDEEEESSYDSEESSSEKNKKEEEKKKNGEAEVLVVGGCKRCFMYYMLPKQLNHCPKCFAQLLHFDRSQNQNQNS